MSTFDYTSRDYTSIQNDLLERASVVIPSWTSRDPSDFGMVMVDLWAYMGDVLHYYVDRAAMESNLATATQRESVLSIANLLDYIPSGRIPARGSVYVDASKSAATDALPIILPKYWRFTATPKVSSANSVIFTLDFPVAFNETGTPYTDSNNVTYATYAKGATAGTGVALNVTEGERYTEYYSATGSAGQRIKLANTGVANYSLAVDVAEGVDGAYVEYTYVDRLLDAVSSSRVYTTQYTSDDYLYVYFGNGVNGNIPIPNAQVRISYRRSRGSAGNLPAQSIRDFDSTILPDGTSLTGVVVVGNTTSTTGGSDAESMLSMKVNIPLAYRTQDRAVSLQDYQDLALRVPGVVKSHAELSGSGVVLSVVPLQGDYSSRTFAQNSIDLSTNSIVTDVDDYLSTRTVAGVSYSVATAVDLTPVFITLDLQVLGGFVQETVSDAVNTAILNLFSFENVEFGGSVSLGALYRTVLAVSGVDYASITDFNTTDFGDEIDSSGAFKGVSANTDTLLYIPHDELPVINADGGIVSSGGA
jgi:hypothetical protein